ncbi:hypothetical protein SLA2020_140650 [Shorea laevis]
MFLITALWNKVVVAFHDDVPSRSNSCLPLLCFSSQILGVFYCGPSALTKELNQLALDFSHKTNTKFDFHKENF